MGFIGDAVGDLVGGLTGSKQAAQAGEKAGQLQYQASMAGVDEQKRQFDKLVELMAPFVTAGKSSMQAQQNLIGLGLPGTQQAAIQALQNSPGFKALIGQGENAILQNASATGGLRGGNTQAALAQFRPQILSELINQQYERLGGLSQLGQASAAGQASAGLQTGTNIANLLQNAGQAQASRALAGGNVVQNSMGGVLKMFGGYLGAKGF